MTIYTTDVSMCCYNTSGVGEPLTRPMLYQWSGRELAVWYLVLVWNGNCCVVSLLLLIHCPFSVAHQQTQLPIYWNKRSLWEEREEG